LIQKRRPDLTPKAGIHPSFPKDINLNIITYSGKTKIKDQDIKPTTTTPPPPPPPPDAKH